MSETDAQTLGRSPRYQVRNGRALQITVTTGTGATADTRAELLDLSREGARLALSRETRCDDRLHLKLESDQFGLDVAIPAVVRWARPAKDKNWLVGCAFANPLPEEAIDALTAIGYLEYDELARAPAAGEATAWRESRPVGFTVRLVDLSPGGVSLLSPDPAVVGQRLRLVCANADDEPTQVIIQARCCAQVADGYFVGCAFESRAAYGRLKAMASPRPERPHPAVALKGMIDRHSPMISRTSILILGGVLVAMSLALSAPHLSVAGLFSLAAYVALELVARNRSAPKETNWQQFFGELINRHGDNRLELSQAGWTAEPIA